jgi:transposase
MSLHPQPIPPIPEETVRVAQAAFAKGNLYLTLRDTLGTLTRTRILAIFIHNGGNLLNRRGNLP